VKGVAKLWYRSTFSVAMLSLTFINDLSCRADFFFNTLTSDSVSSISRGVEWMAVLTGSRSKVLAGDNKTIISAVFIFCKNKLVVEAFKMINSLAA
jgi:hypothetical protein